MRAIFPYLLVLGLFPACSGDDGTTSDTSDTSDGSGTSADEGGDADLNDRELGASASERCRGAMTHAAKLTEAVRAGDAPGALAAYTGTDLQTLVVQIDGAEGTADAAITASLAIGDATELAAVEGRLHAALIGHLLSQLAAVKGGTMDHYASWDEAHCIWDVAVRPIAVEADAVTWTSIDETIAADIDAGFAAGHDGLQGEPPATSADDWQVPPNKQRVEKSIYRAIQRVLVENATRARDDGDPARARYALELFASVENRLAGRNTPGIEQVRTILGGDPAMIDPAAVLLELEIAFAKRTRTYSSGAIDDNALGVPTGYEGAVEGGVYAKLLAPGLLDKVAGFELNGYLAAWDRYAELVRGGTELEELNAISKYLVDTICAYQTALGVSECSSNVDETE